MSMTLTEVHHLSGSMCIWALALSMAGCLGSDGDKQPDNMSPSAANRTANIKVIWEDKTLDLGPSPSTVRVVYEVHPQPETCLPTAWFLASPEDGLIHLPFSPQGPGNPTLDIQLGPDEFVAGQDPIGEQFVGTGFVFQTQEFSIPDMGTTHVAVQDNVITLTSTDATICLDDDCSFDVAATITVEDQKPIYKGEVDDWPKISAPEVCWEFVPVVGASRVGDLPPCWGETLIPDCDTSVPGDSAIGAPED